MSKSSKKIKDIMTHGATKEEAMAIVLESQDREILELNQQKGEARITTIEQAQTNAKLNKQLNTAILLMTQEQNDKFFGVA